MPYRPQEETVHYPQMPPLPVSSPNDSGQLSATPPAPPATCPYSFFSMCRSGLSRCDSAVAFAPARITSIALFVNKRRVELLYAYIVFQLLMDLFTVVETYFGVNGPGQPVPENCTDSFDAQGAVKDPVQNYYYLPGASLSITLLIYLRKFEQHYNILPSVFGRLTVSNRYGRQVPPSSIYDVNFMINDIVLVGMNVYFFWMLYLRVHFTQMTCISSPSGCRLNPFLSDVDPENCFKDGAINLNLDVCQQSFCHMLTDSAFVDFLTAAMFTFGRFAFSVLNCWKIHKYARLTSDLPVRPMHFTLS